jgi:hypothetical protein
LTVTVHVTTVITHHKHHHIRNENPSHTHILLLLLYPTPHKNYCLILHDNHSSQKATHRIPASPFRVASVLPFHCYLFILSSITMTTPSTPSPVVLPKVGFAKVQSVVSGDTVVLLGKPTQPNQPPPQVLFTFSSVSAPVCFTFDGRNSK